MKWRMRGHDQQTPSDPFTTEFQAFETLYRAAGHIIPAGIDQQTLLDEVRYLFNPGQDHLGHPDLSANGANYFAVVVQPKIQEGLKQADEGVLGLAHQVGRVIGADFQRGAKITPSLSYTIGASAMQFAESTVPFSIESGHVVEFGMGINGLLTHLPNLQANRYSVTGIHGRRSLGEVTILKGIASFFSLNDDRLHISDTGMTSGMQVLLRSSQVNNDLVIASRVHGAGPELVLGLRRADTILRCGGLVVGRGPRKYNRSGYDEVAVMLRRHRRFKVLINQEFSAGTSEKNRLIVAQKV